MVEAFKVPGPLGWRGGAQSHLLVFCLLDKVSSFRNQSFKKPDRPTYQKAKLRLFKDSQKFMHFLYVLALYLLFKWIITVTGPSCLPLLENLQRWPEPAAARLGQGVAAPNPLRGAQRQSWGFWLGYLGLANLIFFGNRNIGSSRSTGSERRLCWGLCSPGGSCFPSRQSGDRVCYLL